jgi:hypothetical protein
MTQSKEINLILKSVELMEDWGVGDVGASAWSFWRQAGGKGRQWLKEVVIIPPAPFTRRNKVGFCISTFRSSTKVVSKTRTNLKIFVGPAIMMKVPHVVKHDGTNLVLKTPSYEHASWDLRIKLCSFSNSRREIAARRRYRPTGHFSSGYNHRPEMIPSPHFRRFWTLFCERQSPVLHLVCAD